MKSAVLAVCLLLVMTTVGRAQQFGLPAGGAFYIGGEGGWTNLDNQWDGIPGIAFPQVWVSGFAVGGRAGYQWGRWRLEEEFRYQHNDNDTLVKHSSIGGRAAYALLTNLIYDIPLGSLGLPVTPHVGVGVGAVDVEETVAVPILGLGEVFPGSDWVFGYQAIGGLRYAISPTWALDVDYRYLATTTAHFITPPRLVVDGVARGNTTVASGYESQSVVASLTYRFK